MHFCAILLKKNSHNSGENDRVRKKNKLVLNTAFPKIPGQCNVFVWPQGMDFLSYFYFKKAAITWEKMAISEKEYYP